MGVQRGQILKTDVPAGVNCGVGAFRIVDLKQGWSRPPRGHMAASGDILGEGGHMWWEGSAWAEGQRSC